METTGKKAGGIGGLGIIVCFFLPWILVSCGGQNVATLSGWDLAAGTTINSGFSGTPIEGDAVFFIILLCGFVAAGVSLIKDLNLQKNQIGIALIASGVLTLLILFIKISSMQSEYQQYNFIVEYQIGFFGVVISSLAVIYGGYLKTSASANSENIESNTLDIAKT